MKRHISQPYTCFVWLVTMGSMVTSCRGPAPDQNIQETSAAPATVVVVQDSWFAHTTFEELVNYADIIIIGRPVAEREIFNSSRVPSDISKPDPSYYSIAQVYEVEVVRYIQGEGPNVVYINQHEGGILLSSQDAGENAIQQERERARQAGEFIPLALNERYVLFLISAGNAYVDFPADYFFGNIPPWKFRIDGGDCLYPESEFDIFRYWPPQTLESFLNDIQNRTDYPINIPYPYTGPVTVTHGVPCQVSRAPTPYP